MPENDQQYIVEALREVWTGLHDFCSEFPDDHWTRPVPLPGWDVRSTFTHVFGTEAMLLGRRPTAEVKVAELAHVKNPIGELNEQWVATYAGLSTDELLDVRFCDLPLSLAGTALEERLNRLGRELQRAG